MEAAARTSKAMASVVPRTFDVGAAEAQAAIEAASTAPEDAVPLEEAVEKALAIVKYTEDGKATYLIPPVREAATALLAAGRYAAAARYAGHLVRIGMIDSSAATRSAIVGQGHLLGARAEAGRGDRARARELADRARAPLAVGLGADHRSTREAIALADSLKGG